MKFLLFNITVGCALFYLISGGDLSNVRLPESINADSIKHELNEKFSREEMYRLVDKLTPKPEAASEPKEPIAEATPQPESAPAPVPVKTPQKASPPPPPFPEAVEVAKHTPKSVPTPAAQPEPVMQVAQEPVVQEQEVAQVHSQASAQSTPQSSATSAAERNKMLRQLVRDMERMADSKLLY